MQSERRCGRATMGVRNSNSSGQPLFETLIVNISCSAVVATLAAATALALLSAAASAANTPRPPVSDSALDEALQDKRFIQRQIKCALGEAPCDPVGRRLKTLAPLVLRGSCPQCSKQEMLQIQKTLSYVQRNYPHEWTKIVRQYAG